MPLIIHGWTSSAPSPVPSYDVLVVEAPTLTADTLDAALKHLRVDTDDENDQIEAMLRAAYEHAEAFTGRTFLTQTLDIVYHAFPAPGAAITLPRWPVQSIERITYLDEEEDSTVWASALYRSTLPSVVPPVYEGPIQIQPITGEYYPTTAAVLGAVTVRIVAGYGTPDDVPPLVKLCALEHTRASYERSATEAEKIVAWVERQLSKYRTF